jgi:hypothetical protein
MSELDQRERECLARYCSLLAERLGEDLLAVQMFGSADSLMDPESARVRELRVRIRSQAVKVLPGPVTM